MIFVNIRVALSIVQYVEYLNLASSVFTVIPFLLLKSKLTSTAFRCNNEAPSISVTLFKIKNRKLFSHFESILYCDADIRFQPIKTNNGIKIHDIVVPVYVNENTTDTSTLIHITDYSKASLTFIKYLSLKFLGGESSLPRNVTEFSILKSQVEEMERNCDALPEFKDTLKEQVIVFLKANLKKLGYYSKMLPNDSIYSLVLKKGVEKFQRDYNMLMKTSDILRVDGVADTKTRAVLQKHANTELSIEDTMTANC